MNLNLHQLQQFADNKQALQKLLFVVCLFVGLVWGGWTLAIRPELQKAEMEAGKVTEISQLRDQYQALVNAQEKTEREYQATGSRLWAIIQKDMPPEDDLGWAVKFLQRVIGESGAKIHLKSYNPFRSIELPSVMTGKEQKALFREYVLSSEVECSYHDLGRFIATLENSNPLVHVDSMEIDAPNSQTGVARAAVRVSFLRFNKERFLPEEYPDPEAKTPPQVKSKTGGREGRIRKPAASAGGAS